MNEPDTELYRTSLKWENKLPFNFNYELCIPCQIPQRNKLWKWHEQKKWHSRGVFSGGGDWTPLEASELLQVHNQAAVQEPLFPKVVLSSPQPLGQVRSLCLWLGHGQFCGVSLSFFSSSLSKTNNSSKSGWLHPLHAKGSQRDVMERWEAPGEELSRICSQGWNPGKGKWRWCFLPSQVTVKIQAQWIML